MIFYLCEGQNRTWLKVPPPQTINGVFHPNIINEIEAFQQRRVGGGLSHATQKSHYN